MRICLPISLNTELHRVTKILVKYFLLENEKLDYKVPGGSRCFHKLFGAHGLLKVFKFRNMT